MPILENLDLIRVHGRFVTLDGRPATGSVRFVPNTIIVDPATKEVVLPVAFEAELDGNGRIHTPPKDGNPGHLGIDLPSTDDPDLEPQGWTYQVTEQFGPATLRNRPTYQMELPYSLAGGEFDLAEIAPGIPPSPGQVAYVTLADFRHWVPSDGAAGQVLTRDAAGGASWQDPTGGGGGGGVTPSQLAAAIAAHDVDDEAHDDIRQALAGKVDGDDPRLSDARTPTAHTHTVADLDTTGTASEATFLRGDGTWAAPPGGGGGGVTVHGELTGRSEADQHPIEAITGLVSALDGKAGAGAPGAAVAAHDADADAHPELRSRITALETAPAAFATVVWDDDNDVARPAAATVYWKGWPAELVPTSAAAGDLIFTPDDD